MFHLNPPFKNNYQAIVVAFRMSCPQYIRSLKPLIYHAVPGTILCQNDTSHGIAGKCNLYTVTVCKGSDIFVPVIGIGFYFIIRISLLKQVTLKTKNTEEVYVNLENIPFSYYLLLSKILCSQFLLFLIRQHLLLTKSHN